MNLCKYVLLKNLKERLDYIVYHNDILINSIYYNINTTESIYTQKHLLKEIYKVLKVPIIITTPTTSELIKLSANCWLAAQISYWGEILT